MEKSLPAEWVSRALTSTWALHPVGIAIWLPTGMLRTFFRQALNAPLVDLIGHAAVTGAVAVSASIIVNHTVLRNQTGRRASIGQTFTAYALVLGVVAVAQQLAATMLGIGPQSSAARILAGFISLYLIGCVLDYLDGYRQQLNHLSTEQQRLIQIRASHLARIRSLQTQVVATASQRIAGGWEAVTVQLTRARELPAPTASDLRSCAQHIQSDLIEPIRKLSYEVEELEIHPIGTDGAIPSSTDSREVPITRVFNWWAAIADIPSIRPFFPLGVGICMFLISMINIEYYTTRTTLLLSLGFGLASAAVLALAKLLVLPLIRRSHLIIQWMLFLATSLFLSAVLAVIFIRFWDRTGHPQFTAGTIAPARLILVIATPLLLILVTSWAMLGAVSSKVAATEQRISRTNELIRHETRALEQEMAMTRQRVAHVLHGEVQTLLTAAAFRLELTAEQLTRGTDFLDARPHSAIDAAFVTLDEARNRINAIASDHSDFLAPDTAQQAATRGVAARIQALQQAWTGIAEVTSTIDSRTAQLLDVRVNDASLVPVAVEIVREAILNAVRHAYATRITIDLATVGTHCVITIVNNGRLPDPNATSGLGQTTLNQLGFNWTLQPGIHSGATLYVEVPLLRQPINIPVISH